MNLVISLLVARTYVPRSKIRETVGGYGGQSDEAFERMFERDKEELRELGIPIETGTNDPWGTEEVGYRIRRSEFELPPITFEPDEAVVLGLAARVWSHSSLAGATSRALLKLRAAGVETDPGKLAAIEPRVVASEPAFWPMWEAVRDRQPITFQYLKAGAETPETRRLKPWGIVSWHGHWYAVGHDLDRADTRVFRLDRVVDRVRPAGRPGRYDVPDAGVIRQAVHLMAPRPALATARLRVRQGAGYGLRRRAVEVAAGPQGWDEIRVPYADPGDLAEEIAGYAAHVVAVEPDDVRKRVVAHLRAVVEARV